MKHAFLLSLQILSGTFLIPRRFQWNVVKTVY